jgi:hypothetical protein
MPGRVSPFARDRSLTDSNVRKHIVTSSTMRRKQPGGRDEEESVSEEAA